MTAVDDYWGNLTVPGDFNSGAESLNWLEIRSAMYPFFHELMGLWGNRTGQVVMDYGCGPANDVVGLAIYGNAAKVYGVDVSELAFAKAARRISMHGIGDIVEFVKVSDEEPTIPLPDNSVDFIYSEGVLHHTSHPGEILKEFRRVLKPGGECSIMVYNYDSIWLHLYVAYEMQIRDAHRTEEDVRNVFRDTTDGVGCPISIAYKPADFVALCEAAGFTTDFVGGYYCASVELVDWPSRIENALSAGRLGKEHKDFLRSLETNEQWPYYQGKPAGIGGVYRLT